jgi:uncharacterized protein (DUF305 family)
MNARKQRVMAARVMGASRWRVFKDVLLWESMQPSFVGLRSAVSMALVIVIVAEMFIGSDSGLGHRIINSQQDEILTMQTWLRDRHEPVPEANPAGMKMMMGGVEHVMLMPGMLTEDQMKQLDQARGPEFDRLFLTFMMQHHRGAVSMVKALFDTYGAGQDETVFKFASDVNVDQTTEIARMDKMLIALTLGVETP